MPKNAASKPIDLRRGSRRGRVLHLARRVLRVGVGVRADVPALGGHLADRVHAVAERAARTPRRVGARPGTGSPCRRWRSARCGPTPRQRAARGGSRSLSRARLRTGERSASALTVRRVLRRAAELRGQERLQLVLGEPVERRVLGALPVPRQAAQGARAARPAQRWRGPRARGSRSWRPPSGCSNASVGGSELPRPTSSRLRNRTLIIESSAHLKKIPGPYRARAGLPCRGSTPPLRGRALSGAFADRPARPRRGAAERAFASPLPALGSAGISIRSSKRSGAAGPRRSPGRFASRPARPRAAPAPWITASSASSACAVGMTPKPIRAASAATSAVIMPPPPMGHPS